MFGTTLVALLVIGLVMSALIEGLPERRIPIYSSLMHHPCLIRFLLGIIVLAVTYTLFSSNAAATDTLFVGMMLQTSTQLEILSHRLRKIPHIIDAANSDDSLAQEKLEKKLIIECVRHHCHIFEYVKCITPVHLRGYNILNL